MADVVPSIFNKADFWAMLLPGYITVILGLVIYYPTFPFFTPKENIPIDIFSIVVFVVAGPAVGFILWQIYFHLSSLARFDRHSFNIKYEFQRAYTSLRLVCSPEEREELNLADGRYIFGFSTSIGIGFLSVYALVVLFTTPTIMPCVQLVFDEHSILCEDKLQGTFVTGGLIMVSILLAIGSYFDNRRSRLFVICNLIEHYRELGDLPIDTPSTCKRQFRKLGKREMELVYSIIGYYLEYQRKNRPKAKENPIESELQDEIVDILNRNDLFQGDRTRAWNVIQKFCTLKVLDLKLMRLDWQKLKEYNSPPQLPTYTFRLFFRPKRPWKKDYGYTSAQTQQRGSKDDRNEVVEEEKEQPTQREGNTKLSSGDQGASPSGKRIKRYTSEGKPI